MKEYFVDEIKNKKVYDNFIQYMLEHSDFFPVVYFRNRKDSPLNKYLKNYKKALRPYILHAENTRKWPNTETTYTEDHAQVFYYDLTKEMNHYRTKRPNQ